MSESSTPTESSKASTNDAANGPAVSNGSSPFNLDALKTAAPAADPSAPDQPRRKVYESTLIPDRKSRSRPSAIILVGIIVVSAVLAYIVYAPHPRRTLDTAGKMVYAAADTPGGPSKIYYAGIDGSGAKAVGASTGIDDSPSFSPNGSQVTFISTRSGSERQVFMMDADGQNVAPITRNSGSKSSPTFLPGSNGHMLGFTSSGVLSTADVATGDADQAFPPPPKDNSHAAQGQTDTETADAKLTVDDYAFAPGAPDVDHQSVALTLDDGNIQGFGVLPAIGQDVARSVPVGNRVSYGWSPDGKLLAVAVMGIVDPQAPGRSSLFLVKAPSEVRSTIIPPTGFPVPVGKNGKQAGFIGPEHPVFAPDGETVTFELWVQADLADRSCHGLYRVGVAGGEPTQLARGDAEQAQFTPDGKSVLYLTKRDDGGHDLFEVGADGTGQRRLSDGKQDVTSFSISPQTGK